MEYETAGDPVSGLKWTHKTTHKIAGELESRGIDVGPRTVARLLKTMNFSLRVNRKQISRGSNGDRDPQFRHQARLRHRFACRGDPIVSVDTKKRELVGCFKNPGRAWGREPVPVYDHDFRSQADGIAIPYGIYDLQANRATIFVGTSSDTPEFASDCLARWWLLEGQTRYPEARSLLVLADAGGSNGPYCRAWKVGLQHKLCDPFELTVTVSHFPAGASKWNPIDHRVFSEISKNWAGHPLDSYQTILSYLQTTQTSKGLRLNAHLVSKTYSKGVRISDQQMQQLRLFPHPTLPRWNYTLICSENGK
jgi:hypothetical protein